MRSIFIICLFFALQFQAKAQFTLSGRTVDSAQSVLPFSTVMLLAKKDSALIHFTRSDDKGLFVFKNVRKGEFMVKTTFVGYKPAEKTVVFGDNNTVELGDFVMKPIAMELMEVVIKEARAPLEIRGDTIEYNASTFKVPEGSTVEDLLRKLPGVTVDAEGNIKAHGKDIKRVTVDGKSFFGDDPKSATKNLPAEAISKVQVFDTQSEQSKATGIDDGKKEKSMNLELKEEFKKGGFGKLTAGAGLPNERFETKGNYNKFDDKNQFSLIGLANNTNQTGMNWNDYQDFRGANAFSSFGDQADFGFGGSSGRVFYFGGDDNASSLNIPIAGGRSRGFSKNYALGANYNFDNKKTKFNSSYYFSASELTLDALRERQNFLPSNAFRSLENSSQINFYGNHRLGMRYEKDLDSLNKITVISNSRLGTVENSLRSTQNFGSLEGTANSKSNLDNSDKGLSFSTANSAIFRHKFRKKGRSFAVSMSFTLDQNKREALQFSENLFYRPDSLRKIISQSNDNLTNSQQIKSSGIYIEPLGKKFYSESFFNVGIRNEKITRSVADRENSGRAIDSLGIYYTGQIKFGRFGSGVRYSHQGVNISAGLAAQYVQITGDFAYRVGDKKIGNIERNFTALVPNIGINLDLSNNRYINAEYDVSINQPSTRNLQPYTDNANPFFLQRGNPNLLPTVFHRINAGFSYFNPANFVNIYTGIYAGQAVNEIVYNQITDPKTFITYSSPENIYSGRRDASVYLYTNLPIVKTKLSVSFDGSTGLNKAPVFINGDRNETFGRTADLGTGLNLTPSDFLIIYGSARLNYNKTDFSLNAAPTRVFYNQTYRLEANAKLPKMFFLSLSFNHNIYASPDLDFRQSVPILNASAYRILGKAKKAEIRLSAYDIFNKNLGVSQSAMLNFASREVVQTLARYFMLSFSYNMRGMKTSIKKDNFY
jgi:hypothetical protein